MFSKTMLVFFATLVVATSVAGAQTQPPRPTQPLKPFTEFEKMWFKLPVGGAE
jgi:hypothetical protein